jgi:hypothetical protein
MVPFTFNSASSLTSAVEVVARPKPKASVLVVVSKASQKDEQINNNRMNRLVKPYNPVVLKSVFLVILLSV